MPNDVWLSPRSSIENGMNEKTVIDPLETVTVDIWCLFSVEADWKWLYVD